MNELHPETQPSRGREATVLILKVSVSHRGLIKVVPESPYSTFEFQFHLEIILFEAVQTHGN